MFLDLDGLKQVNDALGHAVGDGMITEAAFVLRETFRASDLIGRMGGDEFCVLFAAESQDTADDRADAAEERGGRDERAGGTSVRPVILRRRGDVRS